MLGVCRLHGSPGMRDPFHLLPERAKMIAVAQRGVFREEQGRRRGVDENAEGSKHPSMQRCNCEERNRRVPRERQEKRA